MDYLDFEKEQEKEIKKNQKYLKQFKDDLVKEGLSLKTIKRHIENVELYINDYLQYYEISQMSDGCGVMINSFLGGFFIEKCMWSTPSTIKSTAASIKKFYKSMFDNNYIDEESYKDLCDIIKENMDTWLEKCEIFNDMEDFSHLGFYD